MPDEENLIPEDDLLLEEENEDGQQSEGAEEATSEQPSEEDKLAALEAEVERLKNLEGVATDLRRSVGRIQSLEQKLQQESTNRDSVVEEINKQFGGVHELLSTVVENIDETALDAATKARVRQAYESSRNAAQTASLRKEASQEALNTLRQQFPQLFQNQANTQNQSVPDDLVQKAQQIERTVEVLFEDRELNPDDPQFKPLWDEGANLIRQGKSDADVRKFFREKLNALSSEEAATDRRQAAKNRAGRGSPSPAGPSGDAADRLGSTKNLDEGVALLREMGVNV